MKITANLKSFTKALSLVAGASPTRTTKDVLKNTLLSAGSESIILAATDGEISLRADVSDCIVEGPCSALLPTARLLAIVRELTSEKLILDISEANGKLTVISGGATWDLSLEDPAEFPPMAEFKDASYAIVAPSVMSTLIKRTVFACDSESTRYALGGVLFEFTNNVLYLVATDSRRLAVASGAFSWNDGNAAQFFATKQPVVPAKAMKILASLCEDGQSVQIAISDSACAVRCGSTVMTSQLVTGRFPDWKRVMPQNLTKSIDMVGSIFHQCLRQAMIVTSEESRGVIFTFGNGILKLQSESGGIGASRIEMPISFEGESLKLTFDPRYMADFAKAIDGAAFKFNLMSADDPAVLECEGLKYVCMPLQDRG